MTARELASELIFNEIVQKGRIYAMHASNQHSGTSTLVNKADKAPSPPRLCYAIRGEGKRRRCVLRPLLAQARMMRTVP